MTKRKRCQWCKNYTDNLTGHRRCKVAYNRGAANSFLAKIGSPEGMAALGGMVAISGGFGLIGKALKRRVDP